MKNIFETVQMRKPRSSAFDLSHEKKLSFNMGELIPTLVQEVVPGDHFKGKTETMVRMAPMIAPVMHRVNSFVHYFFVPNRILWNQWEDFITGGREGTTTPTMPQITFNQNHLVNGSLPDYLGLPTDFSGEMDLTVNALPFWAYLQIYNDYYKDLNLNDPTPFTTDPQPNSNVRYRAWEKDYFTSSLPWAQRGPDVNFPIEPQYDPNGSRLTSALSGDFGDDISGPISADETTGYIKGGPLGQLANIENLDPNGAMGFTVNELRESTALQRWLEKQARGGARYIETILSHFGVKSSDKRLQRAEYLGGGKQPIVISEVLNTSNTAEAPQGNMSGHGISTGVTNEFNYKVEEHGYIFGITSILPRTAYQQGVPRHFKRTDKTEFYWPEFANLGEQEVLNEEVYFDPINTDENLQTFGYQQRYAEYKYSQDSVHGDFRDTLDFWHMGRIFDSKPSLNNNFVRCDPTDRIFAVAEGNKIWAQIYNEIKAKRPMPYFSNPSLL